ncbi:hypothetical protein [Sphingomonas phage Carli]|nr:hypothetical protein [Sphingomonas phage Carli]
MNNARRKDIAAIIARLQAVQSEFESIRDDLQSVGEAEREAYDNMPESLQQSERGEASSAAADTLENAHSELDAIDLESMISELETAAE